MRIVLAQLVGTPGDIAANAVLLEQTLQQHRGADLVVFPELFLPGYFDGQRPDLALAPDHELMRGIARAAYTADVDVVFGFAELRAAGISNSVAHVSRRGELASVYRKVQLFGEQERTAFVPGDSLTVTDVGDVPVGLLNCFDVEFPEHARALARAGADLLVTVAANMDPYGPDHALAVKSRAVENRRFHVYVNRVSREADLTFVGESCIVAPSGDVLLRLGPEPTVVAFDIELGAWGTADVDYLSHVRTLPVTRQESSHSTS